MKLKLVLIRLLAPCMVAGSSTAATVYVTTNNGQVWEYESVADMAAQTSTTTSGTLVASHASFATDRGSTMDLSTGRVYRITGAGDVVEYANLTGFLSNTGSTTLAVGVYTGDFLLNGFSYDGANGKFFATVAGSSSAIPGDVVVWDSIADVVSNTSSSITAAGYGGNLLNFYDPDATAVTAALGTGVYEVGDPFDAHYYQVAGNGRLEGWETLALYAASGNNRSHVTDTNVFGGTTTAWGSDVDATAAFAIPEPSAALLGGLGVLALVRRRR